MAESDIDEMVTALRGTANQDRMVAVQAAIGAVPGITPADAIVSGAILVASGLLGLEEDVADVGLEAAKIIARTMRPILQTMAPPSPDDGIGAVGAMSADPYVIRAGEQP